MNVHQLNAILQNKTVIGITGHHDLQVQAKEFTQVKLFNKLMELAHKPKDVILLTRLGRGADQLAAKAALDAGIPFIVLLPMKLLFYERDFHNDTDRKEFDDLFTRKFDMVSVDDSNEEKNGKERSLQYEEVGRLIALFSDHLIALWDGVYTGERGSTSEIVRIALSQPGANNFTSTSPKRLRKRSIIIHHLVISRQGNPFPVSDPRFTAYRLDEFDWGQIVIPFPVVTYQRKLDAVFRRYKDFILKFLIPFLLVVITLVFGYLGFSDYYPEGGIEKYNKWNAFFASANLITLNSSVLKNNNVPVLLDIARISGLITAIYAVVGAFIWAASDFRKRVIVYWWGKNFCLVIGLNEKSFNLISDLRLRNVNTVVLNDDASSRFIKSCEYVGAITFNGNPTEISDLNHACFKRAKTIFVFTDSDNENVRIMQKIDEYSESSSNAFYIHINELKHKEFLARTTRSNINMFNIYENAARRLLLNHPIDRFQYNYYGLGTNRTIQVILLGFDKIGWELAIAVLRIAHYTTNVSVELLIFTEGEQQKAMSKSFENKYGRVFRDSVAVTEETPCLKGVSAKIKFQSLPESDAELTDPIKSPVLSSIKTEGPSSINIYTCLSDSLKSASCTSLLLPRLNYLKRTHMLNINVFCYYNSQGEIPHEKEQADVEYQLNKIGSDIPIYCFGNLIKICTEDSIANSKLDKLAKQLAFWYYVIYDFIEDTSKLATDIRVACSMVISKNKGINFEDWITDNTSCLQRTETGIKDRIKAADELLAFFWNEKLVLEWCEKCWTLLSEGDKYSNKQAADHIFVKLRCINKSLADIKSISDLGIHNIELLSSIEHRRWCAEKLIDGWHPFDRKEEWLKRGHKIIFKSQKLHYDLRNFDSMEAYEKNKDHNQVIGIPYFLTSIK